MVLIQQDHPDSGADLAGQVLGIMPGFAENPDGPDDDLFLIPLDLNLQFKQVPYNYYY